ncbi:DAO-domain-containing protein [Neolentinus lepideus HHB14362 ss-1]|uniref:DAO-domain-containing protein n=1 Tax=Neolentinus lepideus HHB14362 ss-1 TaxID=1314782 RepID=A0A165U3Y0_9AGAM|nr:DAO-domain-containing protein [Neolentinus lepideus HHB14362 ss-1]
MDSQAWASPWAGANWSPMGDYDERKYKWESHTFNKLWDMIPTGLTMELPTRAFFADPSELNDIPWKDLCRDFSIMENEPLPLNMKAGVRFTTVALAPASYLKWLKSELHSRGVKFIQQKLQSLQEAAVIGGPGCIIVNATALGARSLIGVEDTKCYPIRGQTTIVYAPQVKECIEVVSDLDATKGTGHATYIIPRVYPPGTVLLGGTFQPNNWDTSFDIPTAKGIFERCAAVEPALLSSETQILSYGIGLRPAREGGPRVEVEWIDVPGESELIPSRGSLGEKRKVKVVHAYGFGPAGYQSSWGAAEEAVQLLRSSEA